MKRRPWALVVLAVLHFSAPVGNFLLSAWVSGISPALYMQKVMTPAYLSKNWVMWVTPPIAGLAIYACKRWSLYVYFIAITILFAFSYFGYQSRAASMSWLLLLLIYIINVGLVVYFLVPAVRNIYFDRRMRWWEIRPRYSCNYQVQWQFEDDTVLHPGEVGNISENGLFLKSEIFPREQDMIEIQLPVGDDQFHKFRGQVIFHKKADRIGFGVEFEHTKDTKSMAKKITDQLDAQGKRIQTLELRPEDSFTYWIRTLVTTGRGLFPKKTQ
jgi:hypothetical protein